jgi:hypothetical protein
MSYTVLPKEWFDRRAYDGFERVARGERERERQQIALPAT